MASRAVATTPASVGVRRRLKLLLVVMVLFMSWAAYTLFAQYGQMSERSGQLRDADRRLAEVNGKNEALKLQIERLNDPEYIGQLARKEQGMGLPGEEPIHVDPSGK